MDFSDSAGQGTVRLELLELMSLETALRNEDLHFIFPFQ